MRTGVIYLINPKNGFAYDTAVVPEWYSVLPLAGLLSVAAAVPRDRYEVNLTDENIEMIDLDLVADLVGISAMTSYVNRAYEIANAFRERGVPVS
jgi:hypothetical protein